MSDTPPAVFPTVNSRRAHIFPTLTAAQVARIARHGSVRQLHRGEVLIEAGDQVLPFFVVTSGRIEIVRPSGASETPVVTHGPGGFTGEANMLSGRRSLLRARVGESGEAIEVSRDQLLALVQTDAEISEVLMRAFILRRVELIAHGFGDVVLVGSTHSPGTLRIKEFLTRNGHPHAYVDLDLDADVQELLDRFHFAIGDIPVLICRGDAVLRNPTNQQIADCLGFNDAIDQTHVRDVVIVGAGPSGLAAAVYGASEGLDVLVLGVELTGRPGRIELENRELPRVSDRHCRTGARGTRVHPGAEVRRPDSDSEGRDAARLRSKTVRHPDPGRSARGGAHGHCRHRCGVPQAVARQSVAIRRRRRVLRSDPCRGTDVWRRRRDRGRRRKLCRPGRRVSRADSAASAHVRQIGWPCREHVALSDSTHRREPRDCAAHQHGNRRPRGKRPSRARALAGQHHGDR